MAYEEISPPKKRWQQQSCSSTPSPSFLSQFLLDVNQWRHQSVLVLDKKYSNIYHLGVIIDIIDSHLVTISLRDEKLSSVTIDIYQPINNQFPSIIIDNIPACQDLLINTPVCVRRTTDENIQEFICSRIRSKHPTRLEFSIDLNENEEEKWFTRQNIRLLIEPWHEEFRLHQENLTLKTTFRPISVDLPIDHQQIAYPTPPIEHKDEDDEEVERELQKSKQQKLQGLKKGDIFTMGYNIFIFIYLIILFLCLVIVEYEKNLMENNGVVYVE
jgi:hypothetical protein